MAFNGRAIRLGNTDRFNVGGPGGFPRAGTDLNGTPYVLVAGGVVEITDIPNGSGSHTALSGVSGNQIGGAFAWNNEIYFTLRGATDALRKIDNLTTGATSQVATLTQEIGACTTDGTTVWAYNTSNNTLYTLNPTTGALTEVGVVNFESGVTEGGVQGMLARRGRHYIFGGHNDMMYELTDLSTNPSTITATRVDASVTAFGANATGPAGAFVSGNESYLVDGARDALFRLLDPPAVQANIPRFSFQEGTVRSLDMTQYIDDLESLAFRSGYTPPAYASIASSGTAIDFASTSAVTQDTDLTLQLTASRGMDSVDVDMPIRVRDAGTLSIEAIDEQFIVIGTTDYDLVIDIGGNPDSVKPGGDLEGFNHDWDADAAQLHIRAVEVTRLVTGAVWTIDLRKGTDTLSGRVIYNVIPAVPIFTDPGPQTLYRGVRYSKRILVANKPSVLRGSGLLMGLKSEPASNADGESEILTQGILPMDARSTETSFDVDYYAENPGGDDDLVVNFNVSDRLPLYTLSQFFPVMPGVNQYGTLIGLLGFSLSAEATEIRRKTIGNIPSLIYFRGGIAADSEYFYINHKMGANPQNAATIKRMPINPSGDSVNVEDVVSRNGACSIAVDDNYIYAYVNTGAHPAVPTTHQLFRASKEDPTDNRSYRFDHNSTLPIYGMVNAGDSILAVVPKGQSTTLVYIDKSTIDSGSGPRISKSINMPHSFTYYGMTTDGSTLFLMHQNTVIPQDQVVTLSIDDLNSMSDGDTVDAFDSTFGYDTSDLGFTIRGIVFTNDAF